MLARSAVLHERSKAVRRASGWLRTLGRWGLLVYVSHLLLELPIIAFLTLSDPSPAVRATMLPPIAATIPQAPPRLRAEGATGEIVHDQLLDLGDDDPPEISELPFEDRLEEPAPGELPADGT